MPVEPGLSKLASINVNGCNEVACSPKGTSVQPGSCPFKMTKPVAYSSLLNSNKVGQLIPGVFRTLEWGRYLVMPYPLSITVLLTENGERRETLLEFKTSKRITPLAECIPLPTICVQKQCRCEELRRKVRAKN